MKRAAKDVIDLTKEDDSPAKKRPNKQDFNRQQNPPNQQDRNSSKKQKKKGKNRGFGSGYSNPWAPYGFSPGQQGSKKGQNMGGGQRVNMGGGQGMNMGGQGMNMGGQGMNMGGQGMNMNGQGLNMGRGFGPNNGFENMNGRGFGPGNGFLNTHRRFEESSPTERSSVGSNSGFDPRRRGSSNDFSDGDPRGFGQAGSSSDFSGDQDLRNFGHNFPADDVFSHPSEAFRMKLLPDPEDFVQLTEVLTNFIDPQMAISGAGKWTSLTQSVVKKFNMSQQPKQIMMQKILLWKEMYRALRTEFDCSICVFGSTFNGFGGSGSDLDMCLFPHNISMDAKFTLNIVRRVLRKECRNFIKDGIELVPAKIPILKFFDVEGSLEVDLSVNNPTSIRNTHLLYCYSQLDYRVRPIVLAVKLWAKAHNINEARLMTLSSYTLTLMVIHYLQAAVRPPVLPCLQETYPHVFNPDSDIFHLSYAPQDLPFYQSANTQSIGELFADFINYYANEFDPVRDVGSVRKGRILDAEDCVRFAKDNKLAPGQWNAKLLMEEPFDRTNAARSVINLDKWKDVSAVFVETRKMLQRLGKKAELRDVMSPDLLSRR